MSNCLNMCLDRHLNWICWCSFLLLQHILCEKKKTKQNKHSYHNMGACGVFEYTGQHALKCVHGYLCPGVYACVFVSMLLLCMSSQYRGCGWAQSCPWLSLLIIWWSVRQLSRRQRMSSRETEGLLVLSDKFCHWVALPGLDSCGLHGKPEAQVV